MNKESWYTGKSSDMDVIKILETDDWVVEYDKNRGMYRVSHFENFHFKDEVWFEEHIEIPQELIDKFCEIPLVNPIRAEELKKILDKNP